MSTPTPRQVCPLLTTGTVKASTIVDASGTQGEVKIVPVQCLGPACQLWLHDSTLPPETGDCSLKLSALFSATTATQLGDANANLTTIGGLVSLIAKKNGIDPAAPAEPAKA